MQQTLLSWASQRCVPHFPNIMSFGWGGRGWGVTLEFITCRLTSNWRLSHCWITQTDFSPHKNIQVQREQARGMRNLSARSSLNSKPWDFVFRNYNDRTGGKHPKTHMHKQLLLSVKPMHTKKKKKNMHLTCNSSNLNYCRLCPTHPTFLATVLFSYEGSEKKVSRNC